MTVDHEIAGNSDTKTVKEPKARSVVREFFSSMLMSMLGAIVVLLSVLLLAGTRLDPRVWAGEYVPGENLAGGLANASSNIELAMTVSVLAFGFLWFCFGISIAVKAAAEGGHDFKARKRGDR